MKKAISTKTDKNWSSLTDFFTEEKPKSTKKEKSKTTKIEKTESPFNIKYDPDIEKFPHIGFLFRLEYTDGKEKKTCWFQCESHLTKHITRYKLKDYEATTNHVAFMGESIGGKGTQKGSRRRSSSST